MHPFQSIDDNETVFLHSTRGVVRVIMRPPTHLGDHNSCQYYNRGKPL